VEYLETQPISAGVAALMYQPDRKQFSNPIDGLIGATRWVALQLLTSAWLPKQGLTGIREVNGKRSFPPAAAYGPAVKERQLRRRSGRKRFLSQDQPVAIRIGEPSILPPRVALDRCDLYAARLQGFRGSHDIVGIEHQALEATR